MDLPLLHLSQAHLQVLETCPRKFQYRFLDGLTLPQPSLVSEKQVLGTQFHQLMQQRALGLEIQPLLADNPKLQEWFRHFQEAPPPLLTGFWQSEYQCTLALEEFTLIAVFDLLIQDSTQAQIVDWKTYRRPHRTQRLQQQWQTRLYLFMATEVLGHAPSQISMMYWFAEKPATERAVAESWLSIAYSEAMHQQTKETLRTLLAALRGWMQDFTNGQRNFPQVALSAQKCFSSPQPCTFINQCHPSLNVDQADWAALLNLEAIAEVSIPLS